MLLSSKYSWIGFVESRVPLYPRVGVSSRRVAIKYSIYQEAMEKFSRDLPFDNLFGEGVTRVVVPFPFTIKKRELEHALSKEGPLGKQGYDSIDWDNWEAIKVMPPRPGAPPDPDTPPKTRGIGLPKAVGRLPNGEEWRLWLDRNENILKQGDYSMVISRHPVDVVRMSDHRDLTSCHSPWREHFDSCLGEMTHGGLVAYMVNTEDLESLSPEKISGQEEIFADPGRGVSGIVPVSRLRLRRYTHEDGDFDLAIPEEKTYGMRSAEFPDQVTEWARRVQEPVLKGQRLRMKDFIRRGGEYRDRGQTDAEWFNNFFGDDLDHGDTEFGVAGEEEASQESINDRLREEIEQIHDRWQRDFNHCNTYYEEWEGGDDNEEVRFHWSGGMGLELPRSMFIEERFDEIEDQLNTRYGRNKVSGSLQEYFEDKYFYPGEGEITFHSHSAKVYFGIDVRDPDEGGFGSPDEYDSFCRSLSNEWDDKYDEIRQVIVNWLLDNEFAHPTPVREFSYSDPQFQNFEVDISGGEMEAVAETSIGVYNPDLWDEDLFRGHVDQQIRSLVAQELARIIRIRKHPTGYLPGFQPETPASIKENYNLSNFGLYLRRAFATTPAQINLKIVFVADDVTTAEDMQEVIELMRVVDRIFPRIIAESSRLLTSYYNQMRNERRYLIERGGGDPYNAPTRPFQFDPNLE